MISKFSGGEFSSLSLGGLLSASPPMDEKSSCLAEGRVFCIGLQAIRDESGKISFRLPEISYALGRATGPVQTVQAFRSNAQVSFEFIEGQR